MVFDRTYGRVVISKLLTERKGTTKPSEDLVEKLYTLIYRDFIEEIDARDNGFDNPYTITDSFVTELIDHAMTLIPKDNATQPIKQTQTNRRGGGNKYAKSNNPPKSNNQPPSKHKIMEEINKFSGIKFKPRFSGRLGLSGVSTEVAKLNVAAIYAARTLSDKKDDAEAIATNVLFANNGEDAEKYQKELDNILLEEGKLENDSNSVFSIQRNEHFDQGVQLLSSFFLEAFDAACLKMSKN